MKTLNSILIYNHIFNLSLYDPLQVSHKNLWTQRIEAEIVSVIV
jgi:hypothetical protein